MRKAIKLCAVLFVLALPTLCYAQENPLRKHDEVIRGDTSPLTPLEIFVDLRGGDINEAFQQYCRATRIESLVFEGEKFQVSDIRVQQELSSFIDEETGIEWFSDDLNYFFGDQQLWPGSRYWQDLSVSFSFTDAEWDAIALILEYNTLRSFFEYEYPYRDGPGIYLDLDNFEVIENYKLDLEVDFDKYTYEGAYAECAKVVRFKDPSLGLWMSVVSGGYRFENPDDIRLVAVLISGLELEFGMRNARGAWVDRSGFAIFHGIVAVVFPKPWI